MSRVRPPQDEWARINDLESRVTSLERTNPLQGGGNAVVDANGTVRMRSGPLPDGTFGTVVYAADGTTEMVRLGQLNTGPDIYGLGVRPFGGAGLQVVGGQVSVEPDNVTGTTTTSYTVFPGVNGAQVEVGPSGGALVSVRCDISTGGNNYQGNVAVEVDGSGSWFDFLSLSSGATGGVQSLSGTTAPWWGLAAGTHTFTLGYKTNGFSCSFDVPVLTVSPL